MRGQEMLDFTHAVVVHPEGMTPTERKAVDLLVDEVAKRTRLRWQTTTVMPTKGAVIAIRRASEPVGAGAREGFRLHLTKEGERVIVSVLGNDERGVLFGVGRLLRWLRMSRDRMRLPSPLDIVTAPQYPLRGHQLGYRPKTNSYDGDERLRALDALINWTNPGPGGFYDNLGDLTQQPHLVAGKGFEEDPEFRETPLMGAVFFPDGRTSWWSYAQSLYDAPLRLRYTDLDPSASYKLRVVYAGDNFRVKIRCVANDTIEIHPFISKPFPIRPLEFDIPQEATRTGTLELSWYREPGLGGNGRGCQVAEVWLIVSNPTR